MSEELKTCPFCGGKAEITNYPNGWWSIGCENKDCNMVTMTPMTPTKERAIELWNKRAKV